MRTISEPLNFRSRTAAGTLTDQLALFAFDEGRHRWCDDRRTWRNKNGELVVDILDAVTGRRFSVALELSVIAIVGSCADDQIIFAFGQIHIQRVSFGKHVLVNRDVLGMIVIFSHPKVHWTVLSFELIVKQFKFTR